MYREKNIPLFENIIENEEGEQRNGEGRILPTCDNKAKRVRKTTGLLRAKDIRSEDPIFLSF